MTHTAIIFIIILVGAIALIMMKPSREGYGGPVKNITQIPFNNCAKICESYRNRCEYVYGDIDMGLCVNTMNSCLAECYYSSAHRL